MSICLSCDLSQVRDAKNWVTAGNLANASCHAFSGFPADSSINFIQDQQSGLFASYQLFFDSQEDAAKLSTTGYPRKCFQAAAGIGGKQNLYPILSAL